MMKPKTAINYILTVTLFEALLANQLIKASDEDCFHLEKAATGFLYSPNYPYIYPSSKECIWIIEATPGEKINLIFHSFDLESDETCTNDFVIVYDGNSVNDPLLGRFCGTALPDDVSSTAHRMLVLFHSDNSVQKTGFKASYKRESRIRSIHGIEDIKMNLTEHFLKTRRQEVRSINKWGAHITRTAVALFLNDQEYFSPGNTIGSEIAYELSLQLLSKIALDKSISIKDLALYINALTVSCIDPKNFFGINLVAELRQRVNRNNHTNPFSILTLCNAKDTMTMEDVQQLEQQFDAHFRPVWTDTQAMVVMALSCIYSQSGLNLNETALVEMVSILERKQSKNGTVENLKTTALVVQAILAARNYQKYFDLNSSIKFILEEIKQNYPSTQDIYYILPIFNMMSLANVSSDHCETPIKTDPDVISYLRDLSDESINVQISVIIGDDMDFSRTWKIKVPFNYSLYQTLENIGSAEPVYKAQYSISDGKPYVVAMSNYQDDAEEGLFWFLYTRSLTSTENPKLIEKSPVEIQVNEMDELILWYRSGFWAKDQELPLL